jgi:hypothetical protein
VPVIQYLSDYTGYQSKCRISVGIKTTLGKANNLSIVILWFDYLTPTKVILTPSKKRLNNITSSLLRLIRTLHGCSLLENAGAYSPEQPLFHHSALN